MIFGATPIGTSPVGGTWTIVSVTQQEGGGVIVVVRRRRVIIV